MFCQHDFDNTNGGVAICVRRDLAAQHITLPSSVLECTALHIILPKRKRLVVVVSYRPPDVDSDLFLDSLEEVITPHLSANLCLLGDFNAKNSAWVCGQVTDGRGTALKELADACDLTWAGRWSTYLQCHNQPPFSTGSSFHQQAAGCSIKLCSSTGCWSLPSCC